LVFHSCFVCVTSSCSSRRHIREVSLRCEARDRMPDVYGRRVTGRELCPDSAVFKPMVQMKGKNMRTSILMALLVVVFAFQPTAATHPVKGAVHGTAKAGQGVVTGAGQAGRGVARGTVTAARGVGRGAVCLFTLGTRCR